MFATCCPTCTAKVVSGRSWHHYSSISLSHIISRPLQISTEKEPKTKKDVRINMSFVIYEKHTKVHTWTCTQRRMPLKSYMTFSTEVILIFFEVDKLTALL